MPLVTSADHDAAGPEVHDYAPACDICLRRDFVLALTDVKSLTAEQQEALIEAFCARRERAQA